MTTNLFVIANVKQLRTGGSFRTLLPFYWTSWGVGILNSAIFNSFHNWVEFGTILEGLWNFGGGGCLNPLTPLGTPLEENCALLGYYTAASGSSLTTFQDNLPFPSSRVTCILSNILSQQVYEYEFSGKKICARVPFPSDFTGCGCSPEKLCAQQTTTFLHFSVKIYRSCKGLICITPIF